MVEYNTEKLLNISDKIGSGMTPLRSNEEYWNSQDIPWVKTELLGQYKIFETSEYISNKAFEENSLTLFPANTLSIAMYGEGKTRGNVSIFAKPMTSNQACCNLIINENKAHYKFVYYALKNNYESLRNLASGVRNNLNADLIKNFQIPLPDLPTQKKIADVLSCIDDKIALNNKTNSELENMAKTVYDYWFTQFDFPDANGNPYKSSGGKMEYNQVLKREIPAGWEVKSLDYFGEFKNGINYDPEEIGDTTVKIINVRNITESTVFFNISNFDVLTLKGKEIQKYLTDINDIFIARSGTPGATRLLPPDVKGIVYCGFIIRYKIFDSVNKNYAFFSVKQYENQTTLQAAGTILKNVSQDTLKDIYIPVPEKEILLKFNKKIESIFNMQLKIAKENEELTKLRDYLLPLLMNGQIEVK